MFLHVTRVTHLKAYELEVEFSDGVVKKVDLSRELYGEVFEPLKDPEFFKQVAVNKETNTIEWPNGADFAPEFLYEIGKRPNRSLKYLRWKLLPSTGMEPTRSRSRLIPTVSFPCRSPSGLKAKFGNIQARVVLDALRWVCYNPPMATLYGETILEHFRHPRNYGTLPSPDISHEGFNPLCGDRIRMELKLDRTERVEAARFKGDGCAISFAAASILTEMVQGLNIKEMEGLAKEELMVALKAEIRPSRINCALLPLHVLQEGIQAYKLQERA